MALQRRPAAAEPTEKRHCVVPEVVDLTQDNDDFQPPRTPKKSRSLDTWTGTRTAVVKAPLSPEVDVKPLLTSSVAGGTSTVSLDDKEVAEASEQSGKQKLYYYINNFWRLVATVEHAYGNIFLPSEHASLQRMRQLPDGSLRLFLRLIAREGTWFRFTNLQEKYLHEIPSIDEAVDVLVQQEFAESPSLSELESHAGMLQSLLKLLRKEEVHAVLIALRCSRKSSLKKEALVEAVCELYQKTQPQQVLQRVLEATGRVVAIRRSARELYERLMRLFFLSDGLGHKELFLCDANIIKFPKYSLAGTGSLFPTRRHLTAWEECRAWRVQIDEALHTIKKSKDPHQLSEARNTCMRVLLDSAEWLLFASNELTDPFFLGGSKTATRDGLAAMVRASIGIARKLPDCLVESRITFVEAEELVEKRPLFVRYTAGHSLARLAWDVLDAIVQREKQYTRVNTFLRLLLSTPYGFSSRGEWWERLVINLKHLKSLESALLMAEAGLRDPYVRTGWRHALQGHVIFLAKPPRRWKPPVFPEITSRRAGKTHITRQLLTKAIGKKSQFLSLAGEIVTVEEVALEHYVQPVPGQPRWKGVHTENGVWRTLFSLLLWDAIWADVPDVFHSPFQSAPLDMGLDQFYETRKDLVEKCLLRLHTESIQDLILAAWEHFGERCLGANWQDWTKEELIEIASCIGPKPLAQVLRLLAQDTKGRMGGLPDLLLWSPETLSWDERVPRAAAKLVEVKGPNDRLSNKQEVWISELLAAGIHVEICHVDAQVASLDRVQSAPATLGTR